MCFDPRPRTGGDFPQRFARVDSAVSIHAPARGATMWEYLIKRVRSCFDPRPRTGGDAKRPRQTHATSRFDPRPRTGGD